MNVCARTPRIWSAVTCHRFGRLTDLSGRRSRVRRLEDFLGPGPWDGDKSPAESGENSPHSLSRRLQRQQRQVRLCSSMVSSVQLPNPG